MQAGYFLTLAVLINIIAVDYVCLNRDLGRFLRLTGFFNSLIKILPIPQIHPNPGSEKISEINVIKKINGSILWALPAAGLCAHTAQALATGRYPLPSLTQKIR